MKIVWMRHAHRKMNLDENPELSEEGVQQSIRLLSAVRAGAYPAPELMISSPKKRCLQTLQPLADGYSLSVLTDDRLNETCRNESSLELRQRIQHLVNEVENSPLQCIWLCTHSDWLQEAISVIPSSDQKIDRIYSFACASPLIFEVRPGQWSLL